MSNEKKQGCSANIGHSLFIILPSYLGIIINHYKDPYSPTSILMESRMVFFEAQIFLIFVSLLRRK